MPEHRVSACRLIPWPRLRRSAPFPPLPGSLQLVFVVRGRVRVRVPDRKRERERVRPRGSP